MLKNTESQYGWPHVLMHWFVVLVVVGLFVLGLWMTGLSYADPWYMKAPLVHQSVGLLLVALMVFRLLWRHFAGMPKPLATHSRLEKRLAAFVHIILYLLIICMLLTGYIIVTSEGQPFHFFGLSIPALSNNLNSFESFAASAHEIIAFIIIGVASLHGLAALKHHFIDKDTTLRRMLGR